jgi:FkbM family methyltransferase
MDLSREGEYAKIVAFFAGREPRHRIVVDVGAKTKAGSNSFNLIRDDRWFGVLFEPTEQSFWILVEECRGLDAVVLPYAVADFDGEADLITHKNAGNNSLNPDWMPGTANGKQRCMARTLAGVLKASNIPTDFDVLSVDAEGMDERILRHMFEYSDYRPALIIHEKQKEELKFPGYSRFATTPSNILLARDDGE